MVVVDNTAVVVVAVAGGCCAAVMVVAAAFVIVVDAVPTIEPMEEVRLLIMLKLFIILHCSFESSTLAT